MKNRFQIRKLEFIGKEEISHIEFFDGLNVIYGPSNTGKSLILTSIQYVFGKGKKDSFKGIDELEKFNSIKVTIEDKYRNIYSIIREIDNEKSDIIVIKKDSNWMPVGYRPKDKTKDKDTISDFLLRLTDANDLRIRTSKAGKTCRYTFNKEILVSMISEEKIISKEISPFLTGQRSSKPEEISAFKLLISDSDDSECEELDDPKTYKSKLRAKLELLIDIRKEIFKEIDELTDEVKKFDNLEIESKIKNLNNAIATKTKVLSQYLEERKALSDSINKLKSKRIFSEELLKRFDMHKNNLKSDFNRLNFIIESQHYLNQLIDKNCPICNSVIDEYNIDYFYTNENIDIEDIKKAYTKEVSKIKLQLRDVEKSIKYHENEIINCNSEIESGINRMKELNNAIESEFYPELKILQSELKDLSKLQQLQAKLEEKKLRIRSIATQSHLINDKLKQKAPKNTYNKVLSEDDINEYTKYIETILDDWEYDKNAIVSFDNNSLDISINNKPRGSNGKGHCALQAASMVISLMEYLINNDKIHPGFLILDSPLLSYKEEKKVSDTEKVPKYVQDAFYDTLAKYKNMQIIILENKEPTEFTKKKANVIEFTKDENNGRYGLL